MIVNLCISIPFIYSAFDNYSIKTLNILLCDFAICLSLIVFCFSFTFDWEIIFFSLTVKSSLHSRRKTDYFRVYLICFFQEPRALVWDYYIFNSLHKVSLDHPCNIYFHSKAALRKCSGLDILKEDTSSSLFSIKIQEMQFSL